MKCNCKTYNKCTMMGFGFFVWLLFLIQLDYAHFLLLIIRWINNKFCDEFFREKRLLKYIKNGTFPWHLIVFFSNLVKIFKLNFIKKKYYPRKSPKIWPFFLTTHNLFGPSNFNGIFMSVCVIARHNAIASTRCATTICVCFLLSVCFHFLFAFSIHYFLQS